SPPSVYISTWRRRSVTSTSCAASACSAFSGDSGSATPGTLPATVPNGFGTLTALADVAQLVEHHLAKVRVAGSRPVVRSTQPDTSKGKGATAAAKRRAAARPGGGGRRQDRNRGAEASAHAEAGIGARVRGRMAGRNGHRAVGAAPNAGSGAIRLLHGA